MNDNKHAWVCIGHVTVSGGGGGAGFVIDERDFADADAAQASVTAAAAELRQRGIPHELEHVRVHLDEPRHQLPTWTEYRRMLADDAT